MASAARRARAREWILVGLRMTRPSLTSLRTFCPAGWKEYGARRVSTESALNRTRALQSGRSVGHVGCQQSVLWIAGEEGFMLSGCCLWPGNVCLPIKVIEIVPGQSLHGSLAVSLSSHFVVCWHRPGRRPSATYAWVAGFTHIGNCCSGYWQRATARGCMGCLQCASAMGCMGCWQCDSPISTTQWCGLHMGWTISTTQWCGLHMGWTRPTQIGHQGPMAGTVIKVLSWGCRPGDAAHSHDAYGATQFPHAWVKSY